MKLFSKSALLLAILLGVVGCSTPPKSPQVIYANTSDLYKHENSRKIALVPVGGNAPTRAEREALVRFLKELKVLYPIIEDANSAKRPDQRIPFRYSELKQDLDRVKSGVMEYMQMRSTSPRELRDIEPIKGVYQ